MVTFKSGLSSHTWQQTRVHRFISDGESTDVFGTNDQTANTRVGLLQDFQMKEQMKTSIYVLTLACNSDTNCFRPKSDQHSDGGEGK